MSYFHILKVRYFFYQFQIIFDLIGNLGFEFCFDRVIFTIKLILFKKHRLTQEIFIILCNFQFLKLIFHIFQSYFGIDLANWSNIMIIGLEMWSKNGIKGVFGQQLTLLLP